MKTRFYGDGGTWHQTTDINVEIHEGKVVGVWFRCQSLPFTESDYGKARAEELKQMYKDHPPPKIHGLKLEDIKGE